MMEKWERYTSDEGLSGVKMGDGHSVEWDIEGWGDCCDERMNLVAAAPDLLEACLVFVDTWKRSRQREKLDVALRMAEQAIEKAKPESKS